VITLITDLNQYAIVMCCYAVMAVSGNGSVLFKKVSFLAPIKLTCYAELGGGVNAGKTRNTGLCNKQHRRQIMFISQVSNYTALKTRWNLRLPCCRGLRINPVRPAWQHYIAVRHCERLELTHYSGCQHCVVWWSIVTVVHWMLFGTWMLSLKWNMKS
jgi:hypothetical protein